jgi:hypothetical protein
MPGLFCWLPGPLFADDLQALQSVLEATSNALIASHILHILHHCLARHDAPPMTPEQMQSEAAGLDTRLLLCRLQPALCWLRTVTARPFITPVAAKWLCMGFPAAAQCLLSPSVCPSVRLSVRLPSNLSLPLPSSLSSLQCARGGW